ncbi:macrolide 2'-phosphotransferase [Marinicrinis lubricantis]|uniref:Macrolide 2'-phosphotransferase n=1 Tax=Marinicrinis lubricantis TaxID=2086470 RepID=A0ABW1INF2_9BACL
MTNSQVHSQQEIRQAFLSAAAQNGLQINNQIVEINESGMDFLVAFVTDDHGQDWVLRMPRRNDVWERAKYEDQVLKLVGKQLPLDVPKWNIFTKDLIAYPLLKGHPVATIDMTAGGYVWKYDQNDLSHVFFDSLAETLAALHQIDHKTVKEAGVRVKSADEARRTFANNIEEIEQHFQIPNQMAERWNSWLSTDSYWPDHSALHHGDLHSPHIIVDRNHRVTGLIDWTEAEVADPGKDFVLFFALFGEEKLQDFLKRYEKAGGKVWPRMKDHIVEQWGAYPALVAKFALTTGQESDMEMARGMIANWNVG